MNPAKQLQSDFNTFDRGSKGFLTNDEYSEFIGRVLAYEDGKKAKRLLDERAKANGKVGLKDCLEVGEVLVEDEEKSVEPSKEIVGLLKKIKGCEEISNSDKEMISWAISAILNKEICGPELSNQNDHMAFLDAASDYRANLPLAKAQSPTIPELPQAASDLLKSLDHLDFDIFAYEKAVGRENVLPSITYHVLKRNNLFYYVDEEAFWIFIKKIQAGYKANPYHSDIHASDVVQLCNFLLQSGLRETGKLNDLDALALIVAAAVHDFRHPSVNNAYMVNAKTDLAALYNDQAVLENFHASEASKLLWNDKDCDMFIRLTTSERNALRKKIIGAILATDNARHFEHLGWLERMITTNEISKGKNADKIISKAADFDLKQQLLAVCIHLADVSNPTRAFKTAQEWGRRVTEEFYLQGDREKAKGLSVSMSCDRLTGNLPKSQIGFANVMVKPYVEKLVEIFPKLQVMLDNINCGIQEWGKLAKELELQKASSN